MRFVAILVAVLATTPLLAADGGIVITPGAGEEVPIEGAPEEIVVASPPGAWIITIEVRDETGGVVPGRVESRPAGQTAFIPDVSPLAAGQYRVELVEPHVVETFTVGPDVYAPRATAVQSRVVSTRESIRIVLSEPVRPETVTRDSVRIVNTAFRPPRVVPSRVMIDPAGTTISIAPTSWPGFLPDGDYRVILDETVTDRAGNAVTGELTSFRGYHWMRVPALPPVPECVFWSSKRELSVIHATRVDEPGVVPAELLLRPARRGVDPTELCVASRLSEDGYGSVFGLDPHEKRLVGLNTEIGYVYERDLKRPEGLAISADGARLYAAGSRDHEGVIDVRDVSRTYDQFFPDLGTIRLGRGAKPGSLATSPDGAFVACILRKRDRVAVIREGDESPFMELETERKPQDLAYLEAADGSSVLLVTCRGRNSRAGSVVVFDGTTGERLTVLEGFRRPNRIAASGSRAWIAERKADRVTAVDLGAGGRVTIGPRHAAGRRPVDVALAPDGSGRLFVVNGGKSRITVLESDTGEIVMRIPAPGAIAVTAVGER